MPKPIKILINNFKKQYGQDRATYNLLFIIFVLSFFFRVYRLGDLLGFYYDQGRDALVIWDLWHKGKFFLIGPTTGLAGIFLGPFFYYLIAPFYLIGLGNPVYPAFFLGFLSSLSVFLLYYLGKEFHSKQAGLLAAFIGGFSRDLVLAGRWLSNPTPLLFVSLLVLLSYWKIVKTQNKNWWIVLAILIGIALHFEAASAVFYIPTTLVFFILGKLRNRIETPNLKIILISAIAFLTTLLPQLLFNFRHQNILVKNFLTTFLGKDSFSLKFSQIIDKRLDYFWNMYSSKFFPGEPEIAFAFLLVALIGLFLALKQSKNNIAVWLLMIFIFTPIVGLTLFQGNEGNIFDYYATGIYNSIVLAFAIGLVSFSKKWLKVIIGVFVLLFLIVNIRPLHGYLYSYVADGDSIILGNQKLAVDWVYNDAISLEKFNVDVYVPPVIPHTYDYLFLWIGNQKCGESLCSLTKDEQVRDLYTLYELDPPHPERLEAWLLRQEGIGKVLYEEKLGGVIVQRRERILYDK